MYEERDRTNPLHIRHCNVCGNEWEKAEAHHIGSHESVEDYLDYVRYSAEAKIRGDKDSTWLSDYHVLRLMRLSG